MLPLFTFTAKLKKNRQGEMVWIIESDQQNILCIVDGDWDGSQKCFRGVRRASVRINR